jgi:hypothetical protein
MSSWRAVCQHCQASLTLPPDAGPGRKIKCARCGHLLAPASITSGARAAADREIDDDGHAGLSAAAIWSIVFGTAVAMSLVTGTLLAICLSGQPEQVAVAQGDDDPFDAPGASARPKPAAKKKASVPKALIVLTSAEEATVDGLTARGVQYLKRKQITSGPEAGSWHCPGGYPTGYAALAGLTLLECKTPPTDPVVQAAAQYVRRRSKQTYSSHQTYETALSLLFLARLEDPADRFAIRSLAMRLAASQLRGGEWTYQCPVLAPRQEEELMAALAMSPGTAKRQKFGSLAKLPVGSLDQPMEIQTDDWNRGGDNSNTQFALLALWTARRYDLPLDGVLQLAVKRFRRSQSPSGAWAYQGGQEVAAFPTMTAAGLLAMAIGYGLDAESKANRATDDAIVKLGMRHLATAIGEPGRNSKRPAKADMYFLWSVERVAVLFQLSKIDGKDWYRWGLEILDAYQQPDGHWFLNMGPAGSSDIVDTCFALLFLHRANLAADLTDKIQEIAALLGLQQRKD